MGELGGEKRGLSPYIAHSKKGPLGTNENVTLLGGGY